MPGLEDALANSANGDFGLLLLAFLVVSFVAISALLVKAFLGAIQKILDQNAGFNQQIVLKLDEIVRGIGKMADTTKDYKDATIHTLEKHDEQAKEILTTDRRIENTLNNRPCIAKRLNE